VLTSKLRKLLVAADEAEPVSKSRGNGYDLVPVRKQASLRPLWPTATAAGEVATETVALAALGNLNAVEEVQQAVGDDRALSLLTKAMRTLAEPVTVMRIARARGRGYSRII
jgi:hypothetical protein